MDGHERDCRAVFGHGVHVGTERDPFDEIRKRIGFENAHGRRFGALVLAHLRSLEKRIGIFMGLAVFVDHAEELLDVLDTALRILAGVVAIELDNACLVDDHLDDLAQIATVLLRLMDDAHEFSDGLARVRADALIEHAELGSLQERAAIPRSYRADVLDSGISDAAFRHVDDALCGNIVCGIHDQIQIRHHVTDLGTIEEARAPYQAIRDTRAQQHVFEHTALRIRAVKDRHLVV